MIGILVSVLFFVCFPVRHYPFHKKVGGIIAALLVLSLFMPNFYESATQRFGGMEHELAEDDISRWSIWNFTISNVISDHPFFGIGLGELRFIEAMHYYGFVAEFGSTLDNPHSSFVQIAAMAGCITLLVFILINVLIISRNISYIRKNENDQMSLLLFGLTSGIIGFLVATSSGQDMFTSDVGPVFWLVLGVCFSITSRKRVVSCDYPYPPRTGLRSQSRVDQMRSVSPEAIAGVR